MGTTVRQIRRYVQKIAKNARLDAEETKLAVDCILGDLTYCLQTQNLRVLLLTTRGENDAMERRRTVLETLIPKK